MKIRNLFIVFLTLTVLGIGACSKQEAEAPAAETAPVVEAAPVETAPMDGTTMQGDAPGEMGMDAAETPVQ